MPQITVRYFAAAAEAAGRDEESWELHPDATLDELRAELVARYGAAMQRVLGSGSFLVNGVVRRDSGTITGATDQATTSTTSGTRVDVLPPFAGG